MSGLTVRSAFTGLGAAALLSAALLPVSLGGLARYGGGPRDLGIGGRASAQYEVRVFLPCIMRSSTESDFAPAPTARPTETIVPPTPTRSSLPTPTQGRGDCGRVPTFADGKTPSREIHVSPQGSDQQGDGSVERPYATIQRAARDIGPGAAVRIHAGTYSGGIYLSGIAGTRDEPIWIGGVEGEERPVLTGGGEGLHLVQAKYLVLHYLEVRDARHNGINCDDGGAFDDSLAAHHVVFRELRVHDIGGNGNQDCLKLSGVNHFVVVDSQFARCGGGHSGSGIDHVGCHHGVVARNAFEDHAANAVQAKGGSSDIEVRWNRMADAGARAVNMGGSTGFEYFRPPLRSDAPNAEARDIRVFANVIEGSHAPLAFVGCVECLVANNTIINPEGWLVRVLQETTSQGQYVFEPARDGRLANNLFVFRREQLRTHLNIGPGTRSSTFSFAHNLWFASDSPERSLPDLPAEEAGGVAGIDPELRAGYAIGTDSPAAGAGVAVPGLAGDFSGSCYRDPPSIGALEVSSDVEE